MTKTLEAFKEFCKVNNCCNSLLIEGDKFTCSACGKNDCHFEDNWGGLIVDHSFWGNTYQISTFCKNCWWRENSMQSEILSIQNRAVHAAVKRNYDRSIK